MTSSKNKSSAPAYLSCLEKYPTSLKTVEGREVVLWKLTVPTESSLLSTWAAGFRNHYCPDSEIDNLRDGTGLSRKDFLIDIIFPDKSNSPGPSVRAGDFSEILIADYLEFIVSCWVPRERYKWKASQNESVRGVDILGFRMSNLQKPSYADTLFAFEVKAQLTGSGYEGKLQEAVNHSSKDIVRRAVSLHATKQRLLAAGDNEGALIVQRFQDKLDRPYTYRTGAAAVLSDAVFDKVEIEKETKTSAHENNKSLDLLVIRGADLMNLVHALYERAANEA